MDKDQCEIYLNTVGMEVAEHLEGVFGLSKIFTGPDSIPKLIEKLNEAFIHAEALESEG